MHISRGRFAWLGHPVTVLALAVLIVNDHVLKAAYPGWVTGKLSDAAGLVVAPALLGLVLPRAAAVALVGAGFTLAKATAAGAGVASAVWSLVSGPAGIRADPADLLALPFLGLAWWACSRAHRRPAAGRWERALRVGVLLPLALIGVAATSAPPQYEALVAASTPQALYLGTGRSGSVYSWVISTDGRTWTGTDAPGPEPVGTARACSAAAPRLCYQIVPGRIGVRGSTDGGATWSDSWGITEKQRAYLAGEYYGVDDPDRELVSRNLAVRDVPGGHVVLVANGRDGFARRDVDGTWQRIGFPPTGEPIALDPDHRQARRILDSALVVAAAAILAFLVVTVGAAGAAGRAGASRGWWWAAGAVTAVGAGALAVTVGSDQWPIGASALGLGVLVGGLLAALATAAVVRTGPDRGRWALEVWAAALLTALLGGLVWLAPLWLDGSAGAGWSGIGSPLACVPGLLLVWHSARSLTPPPVSGASAWPAAPPLPRQRW